MLLENDSPRRETDLFSNDRTCNERNSTWWPRPTWLLLSASRAMPLVVPGGSEGRIGKREAPFRFAICSPLATNLVLRYPVVKSFLPIIFPHRYPTRCTHPVSFHSAKSQILEADGHISEANPARNHRLAGRSASLPGAGPRPSRTRPPASHRQHRTLPRQG